MNQNKSAHRLAALKTVRENAKAANQAVEACVQKHWPVNSEILWERHGNRFAQGIVIRHGYDARVQIRNHATGAEYWIRADEIRG